MAANRSSWGAAGPSYILAAARAGTTELHVGRADNLYQLASAFTIRVSLGSPNQEDFEVASVAPPCSGATDATSKSSWLGEPSDTRIVNADAS